MASIIQIGDKWRATVRRKGHPQKNKTFATKAEAKDWATSLEGKMIDGTHTPSSDYTVCDLIDKYRELRELGHPIQHGSNADYMLRHLDQGLGEINAAKLSVENVTTWVKYRLEYGGGTLALGQELVQLRTVFNTVSPHLKIKNNDAVPEAIKLLKGLKAIRTASKPRERRLDEGEKEKLLEVLSPQMQDIFLIASILGFRRSEMLTLKWSDLNNQTKMLWVRNRKDPKGNMGNDSNIPLVLGSYEVISRQPNTDKYIFPDILAEHISDQFLEACRVCGIEGLHFHDLRHEAISSLFEAGLAIQEVALISGHKDWRNLRRYTNLKPVDLHAKLGTTLGELSPS